MKQIQNGGMRSVGDASLFVAAVVVSTTETEKQVLAAASTLQFLISGVGHLLTKAFGVGRLPRRSLAKAGRALDVCC
jgi:hypothetical protein